MHVRLLFLFYLFITVYILVIYSCSWSHLTCIYLVLCQPLVCQERVVFVWHEDSITPLRLILMSDIWLARNHWIDVLQKVKINSFTKKYNKLQVRVRERERERQRDKETKRQRDKERRTQHESVDCKWFSKLLWGLECFRRHCIIWNKNAWFETNATKTRDLLWQWARLFLFLFLFLLSGMLLLCLSLVSTGHECVS